MGRLSHRTGPGFTYFVTTKTWKSCAIFQVPESAEILIRCMLDYRDRGFYQLHEYVVMPNHLHLILTPGMDTSLEKAMQLIKGGSSHAIHQQRENKIQIWQSGFHEESVRDENDYRSKVEYIHMNPVRRHLAERPEDWAHGSGSGNHKMDPMPERVRTLTSGAKAPHLGETCMSELKLRPPKNL